MKKTFINILFSLAIVFYGIPLWASSNLADVESYMNDLLASTAPDKILLILDVDGTLTNYGMPGGHEIKPRGNAVEFVKDMIHKGVNVVVSSAWNSFPETLNRLGELGLKDTLKIGQPICLSKQALKVGKLNLTVDVCHTGLVSSVRDLAGQDQTYYRQKAFGYRYIFPNLDESSITHVVFADDSGGNIQHFNYDLKRTGIFPNATVKTFTLSPANGEKSLK